MKIGIIGSGNIGANAAGLFVRAGHEVALSNSRGGQGLEALVAELGGKVKAATIEEAARFGLNIWRPKAPPVQPSKRDARFSSPVTTQKRKRSSRG